MHDDIEAHRILKYIQLDIHEVWNIATYVTGVAILLVVSNHHM